jgi:molybdopterin synthase catalytic subunit
VTHVTLSDETIDVAAVSRRVEDAGCGAVVTFAGNIRDNARGQGVLYLEYEAYAPLAHKQLLALGDEAETRWGVRCAVQHRLGRLEIGECSVVVAIAAPHRAEAFDACRWLMDTLKASVPIWKKEYFVGGAHWIEGPQAVLATPETDLLPPQSP